MFIGLDTLLTENEMRALLATATPATKSLVSVLALALFRNKSVDPDIDFEFRADFISHVNSQHNGSIDITTRSKVSKLKQYFDGSRMYVDSLAMKKWLDSNPTIPAQEYRSLYTRIEAKVSDPNKAEAGQADFIIIIKSDQSQHLGIESYLGRRIRHNTLDGVTTEIVDAVLRKHVYKGVGSSPTVESWLVIYKAIIDKLRRVNLQFSSGGSLFKSTLDLEDVTTKENIRQLSTTLASAGGSNLLNDLVVQFCWKQITPQLENAARYIRTNLLQEANASIDKAFSGQCSALEDQMKAELHEAVNEVFKKIADWFQVPQTGFVSASVRDLCQIILIELNRTKDVEFSGSAVDVKYTGISVHRLYDCLAVLLQNAHKHGEEGAIIFVNVSAERFGTEINLDKLSISIVSTAREDTYDSSKERIFQAIHSAERGSDMVTEGYTGIKKIKYITRNSEGAPTIRCEPNDKARQFSMFFTLHAESVSTSNDDGATF